MTRFSLIRFESYRWGLIASMVASLASQAVAFVTVMLFAWYFGAGTSTDVYLYCTSFLWLAAGFITSLDGSVVIPEFMRISAQEGRDRGFAFANMVLILYTAVAAAVMVAVMANPGGFLRRASQFTPDVVAEHWTLVAFIAPLLCGEVLTVYLADLLASQKYFTVPMLSTLANRLMQAAFLLVLHDAIGIRSIVVGSLVAYVLQIALLAGLLRVRLGWQFRVRRDVMRPGVVRNASVALVGNAFTTVAQGILLYFLSGIGAGLVTAANYASRVLSMPQTLLTTQVSSVTALKMNDLHARGERAGLDLTFRRAIKALVFVLTPLAAFLWVEASSIVRVLFERGKFNSEATAQASLFLRYLALTLPLLGVNTIVARLFMATQRIGSAVWYQSAQNLLLIAMVWIGIRQAGATGYLAAVVLFHAWNLIALVPLIGRVFPEIGYRQTLIYVGGMSALCALCAAAAYPLHAALSPDHPRWSIAVTGTLFAAVLALANGRFRLNDDIAGFADVLLRWPPLGSAGATSRNGL